MHKLETIGRSALVDFIGHAKNVPAKVDTGADGSAVWASDIFVDPEHVLHFKFFGEGSEHYTGEDVAMKDFGVSQVRSSSGHIQVRYRVKLSVRIGKRRFKVAFTLADRTEHKFPVLIGRRTLHNKFTVDVAKSMDGAPAGRTFPDLTDELRKDPYGFYKKYHLNNEKR